jgi:hypothetical protein
MFTVYKVTWNKDRQQQRIGRYKTLESAINSVHRHMSQCAGDMYVVCDGVIVWQNY